MLFKHPQKVCLTYWSHMKFSFYLSYQFGIASIAAFCHGIYPDILVTHSTDTVNRVTKEMEKIGCRDKTPPQD